MLESFPALEADINEKFSDGKLLLFVDFLREDVKNEDGIVEQEAEKIYEAINNLETLR